MDGSGREVLEVVEEQQCARTVEPVGNRGEHAAPPDSRSADCAGDRARDELGAP